MTTTDQGVEKDPFFAQVAELLGKLDNQLMGTLDDARQRAEKRQGLDAGDIEAIEDPTYTAAMDLESLVHFLHLRAKRIAAGDAQARADAAAQLDKLRRTRWGLQ